MLHAYSCGGGGPREEDSSCQPEAAQILKDIGSTLLKTEILLAPIPQEPLPRTPLA